MKSTKNKLYTAILASLLATSVTACGGSGSSDPTPEIKTVTANLEINSNTYRNNLFCYNQATADEKICNIRMFQVMVEAFQDGDESINYNIGYGPSNHKGDLQGIIDSLGYIQGLGMNAIWLTPVFQSTDLATPTKELDATGYFGEDYYKVDPHFGNTDKLKELVDAAHERGIYVFLDGVFGHFKGTINTLSPTNKQIVTRGTCTYYNSDTSRTYEKEVCNENATECSTKCSDFGDDSTLNFYKELAAHYITEYKIDGWRLDQAYQVPVSDWKEIREAVEAAAAVTTYQDQHGESVHPLGYMVGEVWGSEDGIKTYGYGSDTTQGLKSNFDFNTRYGIVQALAVEEYGNYNHSGVTIQNKLKAAENTYPDFAVPNYFLTNHDVVRFGDLIQRAKKKKAISSENYFKRYKVAHAAVTAMSGPITLYYGDEWGQEVQGFDVKVDDEKCSPKVCDDHVSRSTGKISDFNPDQENLKNFVTNMMKLRAEVKAISMGSLTDIGTDKNLFAVKKTYGDSEVLVVLNVQENVKVEAEFDASIFNDAEAQTNVAVFSSEDSSEDPIRDPVIVYPEGTSYKVTLEPLSAVLIYVPQQN
ncbi:alpha-amylase family glycosyl hydrolase [uncultured Ruminobacter sp.]|uniref:alpha-amylase family glycosyl hydrolase n=1 Tax=uncultured Ruminobacter sp. TaxID=538947 RepID=UPI0025EBB24E|nr:alpha-amylase family glycosyl hydrolase [uncultured Ruminobacter sp.]